MRAVARARKQKARAGLGQETEEWSEVRPLDVWPGAVAADFVPLQDSAVYIVDAPTAAFGSTIGALRGGQARFTQVPGVSSPQICNLPETAPTPDGVIRFPVRGRPLGAAKFILAGGLEMCTGMGMGLGRPLACVSLHASLSAL